MKKALLASLVVSLVLVGCGGGGGGGGSKGGSSGNTGGGTGVIPADPKPLSLKELANIENDAASAWYQFTESSDEDYYLTTHVNYNDPYELSFKDGKIFSLRNSALDESVYPTYIMGSDIYRYEASDTSDNMGQKQRIGKYTSSEVVQTTNANGSVNTLLNITYTPYKGDSGLTITQTYKVTSLNGARIGQTLNPALYAQMNDPLTSPDIVGDDDFRKYVPAMWQQHPSKLADERFTNNAVCLTFVSSTSNNDYFFSKTTGVVPTVTRQQFDETYDLEKQPTLSDVDKKIDVTLSLGRLQGSDQINPLFASVLVQPQGQPSYTSTSFIGNYVEGNKVFDRNMLDNLAFDLQMQQLTESDLVLTPVQSRFIQLRKENLNKGCDLYNTEARNQARSFLVKVNNRTS